MKGAIASVEIFLVGGLDRRSDADPGPPRRLTLVVGGPERSGDAGGWRCRVALADLHRPVVIEGRDSVEALSRALEHARHWIAALRAEGHALYRDRSGLDPFTFPERGSAEGGAR